MKKISEFVCKICNKPYSSYQSLWNHNKKFHTGVVSSNVSPVSSNVSPVSSNVSLNVSPNITTNLHYKIKCKFCSLSFNHRSSKSRHEKKIFEFFY